VLSLGHKPRQARSVLSAQNLSLASLATGPLGLIGNGRMSAGVNSLWASQRALRRARVHGVTRRSKPLAVELVVRQPSFPEDCQGSNELTRRMRWHNRRLAATSGHSKIRTAFPKVDFPI
jgi:hypothetical protein